MPTTSFAESFDRTYYKDVKQISALRQAFGTRQDRPAPTARTAFAPAANGNKRPASTLIDGQIGGFILDLLFSFGFSGFAAALGPFSLIDSAEVYDLTRSELRRRRMPVPVVRPKRHPRAIAHPAFIYG